MKALLILGMLVAHSIDILSYFLAENSSERIDHFFKLISLFVNITAFSSFLFCFGYVFYLAYLRDLDHSRRRLAKNGINTLIVYYLSTFGVYVIEHRTVGFESAWNLLNFNHVGSYSEFLLAFFFISFLCIFAGRYMLKLTADYRILLLSSCLLLLSSFLIPYHLIPSQLGIFIGSTQFYSYPILLYLPYFLLGVYLARNNMVFNKYVLIGTAVLSFSGIVYLLIRGVPDRFPPSFFWLTISFFYTYCLYLFCTKISQYNLGLFFKRMGENTLLYLLISNLIFKYFEHYKPFNAGWIGIFIAVGIACFTTNQIIKIVRK